MTTITQQARDMLEKACSDSGTFISNVDNFPGSLLAVQRALDAARPTMSDAEMLQRAREAGAAEAHRHADELRFRDGSYDSGRTVRTVLHALRNLDKPIVDPVVLKCREILASYETNDVIRQQVLDGQWDDKPRFLVALAAYKAGTCA